jgi:cytochrome P450
VLRGLLYIMCRDPELQNRLRRDPSLVPAFVDEGLRFLAPFRTLRRVVKKDVELGGQALRRGDSIYLITPLANRDEARWQCPHEFDAERKQETTHLTFGFGQTYCVGRYVGRVEAIEAVNAILAETSAIEIDPNAEQPKWQGELYHTVMPINVLLWR